MKSSNVKHQLAHKSTFIVSTAGYTDPFATCLFCLVRYSSFGRSLCLQSSCSFSSDWNCKFIIQTRKQKRVNNALYNSSTGWRHQDLYKLVELPSSISIGFRTSSGWEWQFHAVWRIPVTVGDHCKSMTYFLIHLWDPSSILHFLQDLKIAFLKTSILFPQHLCEAVLSEVIRELPMIREDLMVSLPYS